jgi:hypothetical protein
MYLRATIHPTTPPPLLAATAPTAEIQLPQEEGSTASTINQAIHLLLLCCTALQEKLSRQEEEKSALQEQVRQAVEVVVGCSGGWHQVVNVRLAGARCLLVVRVVNCSSRVCSLPQCQGRHQAAVPTYAVQLPG